MAKSTLPALRPTDTQALLNSVLLKLDSKETELRELEFNRSMPAPEVVHRRATLKDEILRLQEETKVLQERLDLEAVDEATRLHAIKVSKTKGITKRRYSLMQRMDEGIAIMGEAASAIHELDELELEGEVAGCDARFEVQRSDWMQLALRKLAELGIGTDRRQDRGKPIPTMAEDAERFHRLIIQELVDLPNVHAAEKAWREGQQELVRKVANY